MVPPMDPNHLILGALIALGFVGVFGIRHILTFLRQQKEAEKAAEKDAAGAGEGGGA